MNPKLKVFNPASPGWEKEWEENEKASRASYPLQTISRLPSIPGITKETAKRLKWKSLRYLLSHDTEKTFLRYFRKKPLKYTWNLLKSYAKGKSYKRENDFFYYGLPGKEEFIQKAQDPNTLLVLGFSYCHKPLECPSGRFSDKCQVDFSHLVCSQCYIGKILYALSQKNLPQAPIILSIPTIHYIGKKMFELRHQYPNRPLLFLITACEMTLEMFGDWGNMVEATGIGVRLDGRICNTMKAFELSEKGIKPGLTVVTESTQKEILDLLETLQVSPF